MSQLASVLLSAVRHVIAADLHSCAVQDFDELVVPLLVPPRVEDYRSCAPWRCRGTAPPQLHPPRPGGAGAAHLAAWRRPGRRHDAGQTTHVADAVPPCRLAALPRCCAITTSSTRLWRTTPSASTFRSSACSCASCSCPGGRARDLKHIPPTASRGQIERRQPFLSGQLAQALSAAAAASEWGGWRAAALRTP